MGGTALVLAFVAGLAAGGFATAWLLALYVLLQTAKGRK